MDINELQELRIEIISDYSDEIISDILDINLKRDLPIAIHSAMEGRTATLCGAGPSLLDTLSEFKGDIWACNGAYNALQDKGIIADYFFCWDSGKELLPFLSRPHKDTTFYIASICLPEIFDLLKDYKVVMWHPFYGKATNNSLLRHKRHEYMVGGGSACMTRAPFLLTTLGYKEIHLHGADSSMRDDISHVGDDGITGGGVTEIICAGRKFKTPLWLAAQSQELIWMNDQLKEQGVRTIVHGDGLLPHIAMVSGLHYNNVI